MKTISKILFHVSVHASITSLVNLMVFTTWAMLFVYGFIDATHEECQNWVNISFLSAITFFIAPNIAAYLYKKIKES